MFCNPHVVPHFCKSRTVPYALRARVEDELERLVELGVLEPVQFAEWAAPIVLCMKSDKSSIRICGDFKITINCSIKLDQYPFPKIEDLFAKLSGGKMFTKLDLSQAYQQVRLDAALKKLVVINTRGLFRYYRLPFGGVSSAPEIFPYPFYCREELEKEGHSCVFGVKRFHSFLYGHNFTMCTDHKPLLGLIVEHCSVPAQASARIQPVQCLLKLLQGSNAGLAFGTIARKPCVSRTNKHLD